MSICDGCIHDDVCGLEDNHEEAVTFCADMIEKNIFDKIKAEIEQVAEEESKFDIMWAKGLKYALEIIDKYNGESEEAE